MEIQPFRFFDLPLEIRNQILYQDISDLSKESKEDPDESWGRKTGENLKNLALTSRYFYNHMPLRQALADKKLLVKSNFMDADSMDYVYNNRLFVKEQVRSYIHGISEVSTNGASEHNAVAPFADPRILILLPARNYQFLHRALEKKILMKSEKL